MSWHRPKNIESPNLTPVVALAAGVIQHMNEDHADALLLLAGQKPEALATQAEMVSCDAPAIRYAWTASKPCAWNLPSAAATVRNCARNLSPVQAARG